MDWVQTKPDQRIRSDLLLTGREGREREVVVFFFI